MTIEPVQIIYLNGPSSSGKTTLAKALQHAFTEPFVHVGIDKIIGWMPEKVNDWTGGEAPIRYSWKKSEDASGNPIQELQAGPYAQKIGKTSSRITRLDYKIRESKAINVRMSGMTPNMLITVLFRFYLFRYEIAISSFPSVLHELKKPLHIVVSNLFFEK